MGVGQQVLLAVLCLPVPHPHPQFVAEGGRVRLQRSPAERRFGRTSAPAASKAAVIRAWVAAGMYCHMIEWNITRAVPGCGGRASMAAAKSPASAAIRSGGCAPASAIAASIRAMRSEASGQT